MGTVRVGAVGAGERRARVQFRRIGAGTLRQIREADRAVGTGDANDAVTDPRSLGLVSSASAAIARKLAPSWRVARSTLTPPVGIEAEPPVPRPVAILVGVALMDVDALGGSRTAWARSGVSRYLVALPIVPIPIRIVTSPSAIEPHIPVSLAPSCCPRLRHSWRARYRGPGDTSSQPGALETLPIRHLRSPAPYAR